MKPIFSACPHDVVLDPEKWAAFARYIRKKSGTELEFKRFESFDVFARNFDSFSFVYAHPLHAVQLGREKGYLPVAKYEEVYDEAVIISRKTETGSDLRGIAGRSVACVHGSPSHAAFLIDLHKTGTRLEFEEVHQDTYPKVQMAVSIGEADFGVILKSVWDDMLTLKERVRVHCATSSRCLVHAFMLSPRLGERRETFRGILASMGSDPEGREILRRLRCKSIRAFDERDLKELESRLSVCNYDLFKAA